MTAQWPTTLITQAEAHEAILGHATRVTSRVRILERQPEFDDQLVVWREDVYAVDGQVSIDAGRDERRVLQAALDVPQEEDPIRFAPGYFWYDKVIHLLRGVATPNGQYEASLGYFMLDTIKKDRVSGTINISARDYTKRMKKAKFVEATQFSEGQRLEEVVRAVAVGAGVRSFALPSTGVQLARDYTFDRGDERWDVADLALSHGYELYFNPEGSLAMRELLDPLLSAPDFTFETGPEVGNIADIAREATDARIVNRVVVAGESQDPDVIPVWADAVNDDPDSLTSTVTLGYESLKEHTSAFIDSRSQAEELARKLLKRSGLEQFQVDLDTLVFPWMDAGIVARFIDPSEDFEAPDRYFVPNVTIPLGLGTMKVNLARVVMVEPTVTSGMYLEPIPSLEQDDPNEPPTE